MTKKDFKQFATMIIELEKEAETTEGKVNQIIAKQWVKRLESKLVNVLSRDNYRFDWQKWEFYKEKVRKGQV